MNLLTKLHNIINELKHPLLMYISIVVLSLSTFLIIYNHPKKRMRSIRMLTNINFLISITIAILFSIYIYKLPNTKENERIKDSTKEAVLALIIAILAYIEITVLPFWLILVVSYYLDI
jgi:Na+-translocating ferredoxin:NAD+ oxidoreductase RnfD subunit